MRLINKNVPKRRLIILLVILLWVLLCNYLVLFLESQQWFQKLPFVKWAFSISMVIFFMMEHLSYKERFFETLCGGAVGILLARTAAQTVAYCVAHAICDQTTVVLILVPIILLLNIYLHAFIPLLFNSAGFAYYVFCSVTTVTNEGVTLNAVNGCWAYLFSLAAGMLLMVGGSLALIRISSRLLDRYRINAASETN